MADIQPARPAGVCEVALAASTASEDSDLKWADLLPSPPPSSLASWPTCSAAVGAAAGPLANMDIASRSSTTARRVSSAVAECTST